MIFTTTGSEATAYAMRMARAATGRTKILKFEGAFHGNHDYAGIAVSPPRPSVYPLGDSFTHGTPDAVRETVLVCPYNDLGAVREVARDHAGELAGIIVEPVQRIIRPVPGFLEGLRTLCDELGVVLIFDEVVTGFRLAYGGAQELFGVQADIASYGKIIGGGGPMGAVVGKADLIDMAHPDRKGARGYVYASGTLHGNPLGAAAGLATLRHLKDRGVYRELEESTGRLTEGLRAVLTANGVPAIVETIGSIWQILHMPSSPRSYTDFLTSDLSANSALEVELMRNGVNVIPGLRRFVSLAHDEEDFGQTFDALDEACRAVKGDT